MTSIAPPTNEVWRRIPRVVVGLILFGLAIALMVRGDFGLPPWDVLHQGLSERTGISIGLVTMIVGAVVMLGWIPLRERPGLGTVLNIVVIGASADVFLWLLERPTGTPGRIAFTVVGAFLFGPGSGLYIGAGLGPGPRDGLMTGLARRGLRVAVARTAVELVAMALGWSLGGTVGVGTVVFAATVGPNVAFFLRHWTLEPISPRVRAAGSSIPGPSR